MMDRLRSQQPHGLRLAWLLCLVGCLLIPVNGLYFYLDSTEPKCFFEDLPKDTLVVGAQPLSLLHSTSPDSLLLVP